MACSHQHTRAIYEQRPPSEGRKLHRIGSKCEDCLKLLPVQPVQDNASRGGKAE